MPKKKKVPALVVKNAPAVSATPSVPPPPEAPGVETVNVGQETLDGTPVRLMLLLRGIGTLKAVRETLRAVGYSASEHARGWQLLHGCSGFVESDGDTDAVAATIAELDAWDEPKFTIAEAALRHRHPAQHAFVFRDLKPARGVEAVVGVHTFLSRLDALESSPDRADSRVADHAALATLAERGINAAERERVGALVRAAESLSDDDDTEQSVLTAAEQEKRMRAARAFYEEWSTIARTLVERRDHLIRLGLAQRRYTAEEPTDDPPQPDAPKPA